MRDKKVKVEGCCKFAPDVLGIMDTIILSIRYITILALSWFISASEIKIVLQRRMAWFTKNSMTRHDWLP